jgi:hypothetical protein
MAQKSDGLLLIISLLFLFHPATGWGFFQLVYSERLLTFLFAGFIFSTGGFRNTDNTEMPTTV